MTHHLSSWWMSGRWSAGLVEGRLGRGRQYAEGEHGQRERRRVRQRPYGTSITLVGGTGPRGTFRGAPAIGRLGQVPHHQRVADCCRRRRPGSRGRAPLAGDKTDERGLPRRRARGVVVPGGGPGRRGRRGSSPGGHLPARSMCPVTAMVVMDRPLHLDRGILSTALAPSLPLDGGLTSSPRPRRPRGTTARRRPAPTATAHRAALTPGTPDGVPPSRFAETSAPPATRCSPEIRRPASRRRRHVRRLEDPGLPFRTASAKRPPAPCGRRAATGTGRPGGPRGRRPPGHPGRAGSPGPESTPSRPPR